MAKKITWKRGNGKRANTLCVKCLRRVVWIDQWATASLHTCYTTSTPETLQSLVFLHFILLRTSFLFSFFFLHLKCKTVFQNWNWKWFPQLNFPIRKKAFVIIPDFDFGQKSEIYVEKIIHFDRLRTHLINLF